MFESALIAFIMAQQNIIVPTIPCVGDVPVQECLDDAGFGNYEIYGPFDREDGELVYIGYLDPLNQINIVVPTEG